MQWTIVAHCSVYIDGKDHSVQMVAGTGIDADKPVASLCVAMSNLREIREQVAKAHGVQRQAVNITWWGFAREDEPYAP
jgi:hypothetical protein